MSVQFQGHQVVDGIFQACLDACKSSGSCDESRPYNQLDEIDKSVVHYSVMQQLLLMKKFEMLRTLLKHVPHSEIVDANLVTLSIAHRLVEPLDILFENKIIDQARYDESVGKVTRAASFRSLPKA